MKHIKSFFNSQYKIGDYILLNINKIKLDVKELNIKYNENYSNPTDKLAQIIDFDDIDEYPIVIKFYNDETYYIQENQIKRLLTTEEINEYKTKQAIIKYNL